MQKNFTITHIGDTELSLPMPFIFIEAKGKSFEFQADDGTNLGNKEKSKTITFENDYYLCAYPTTQEFWEAVVIVSKTKELEPNPSHFKGKTRPVEKVSWDDIQLFNKFLNELFEKEGIIKVKENRLNGTFSLPSETQWEYAANAYQGLVFAGSQNLNDVGWYIENSNGQTMPVGLKVPNAIGLFDMSGNVWEWCADFYSSLFDDIPQNGGPYKKESEFKVFRGGSCFGGQNYCRTRNRSAIQPKLKGEAYGFRLQFSPSSSDLEG
jgi:formylglycine-generating enzyme